MASGCQERDLAVPPRTTGPIPSCLKACRIQRRPLFGRSGRAYPVNLAGEPVDTSFAAQSLARLSPRRIGIMRRILHGAWFGAALAVLLQGMSARAQDLRPQAVPAVPGPVYVESAPAEG